MMTSETLMVSTLSEPARTSDRGDPRKEVAAGAATSLPTWFFGRRSATRKATMPSLSGCTETPRSPG